MAWAVVYGVGTSYGGPYWPACGARLVPADDEYLTWRWTAPNKGFFVKDGCSSNDLLEVVVSPWLRLFHHVTAGRWWAVTFRSRS